jgi:uncharacterized membrane protein YeaQ/YmgE (transglycosylase-associated protein family)
LILIRTTLRRLTACLVHSLFMMINAIDNALFLLCACVMMVSCVALLLRTQARAKEASMYNLLWVIVIGFVAGIIARMLSPGPNNPAGFILTTILGIVGAFLATMLGQAVGWYRADQGAGFIGATVGALIVLFIWNRLVVSNKIKDPGNPATSGTPPRRWL